MSFRPIVDFWLLARPKVRYHGAYPNGLLERVRPLLGVTPNDRLLHVCGGMAAQYPNQRRGFCKNDYTLDLDRSLKPHFVQNAEDPYPLLNGAPWDALFADPPYTALDADEYAPGRLLLPRPHVVLRRMLEAVKPGGKVGMLHYVCPRPPRDIKTRFIACVGVLVGFDNRIRCFSVFEREAE